MDSLRLIDGLARYLGETLVTQVLDLGSLAPAGTFFDVAVLHLLTALDPGPAG